MLCKLHGNKCMKGVNKRQLSTAQTDCHEHVCTHTGSRIIRDDTEMYVLRFVLIQRIGKSAGNELCLCGSFRITNFYDILMKLIPVKAPISDNRQPSS